VDSVELKPLTSLRFFAAMLIVLLHIKVYFHWTSFNWVPGQFVSGVTFFFVLSGFILTHVYIKRGTSSYFRFLQSRVARLWPAHLLSLAVLAVFVGWGGTFPGQGGFRPIFTTIANLFMVQSWSPYMAYFFSWNSVSWSISTEFFFYLLFPTLLINIKSTWHWKLALALCLTIGLIAISSITKLSATPGLYKIWQPSFLYCFPPARLFEFSLGMAAWVLWDKYINPLRLHFFIWTAIEFSAIGVTLWWLLFVPTELLYRFGGGAVQYASTIVPGLMFPLLIMAVACGRGAIGKILSIRPFVYLGNISFSMYLFHYILIRLMPNPSPFVFFLALAVVPVLVFELVEKPCRSAIVSIGRKKIVFSIP
jgi:peptidoglycan/LPS O-acetylase OafA/YrhL